MKLNFAPVREAWHARSAREKTCLIALGALLGIALLYSILWAPVAAHRARLRSEIPVLQSELAQMKQAAQEARRLAPAVVSTALSGDALTTALTASLAAYGLNSAKISNERDGTRIQFSATSFSSWVSWLENARKQYKVRVTEAQIKALAQDGLVEVDALLQPPQP